MKRFAILSLTLAATLFTLNTGANAQAMSQTLDTGNARLVKTLDTSSAMQGQIVTAKLTDTVKTNGVKLPKGTDLIGHIVQVQAAQGNSGAKLTITFDKARMKDGQEMPIQATLVDIARFDAPEMMTTTVSNGATYEMEDRLGDISLKSNVGADNSGTLTSKDKNIKLDSGTDLLVAVAPHAASTASGS